MTDFEKVYSKIEEVKNIVTEIRIENGKVQTRTNTNTDSIKALFRKADKLTWGFIGLLTAIITVAVRLIAG